MTNTIKQILGEGIPGSTDTDVTADEFTAPAATVKATVLGYDVSITPETFSDYVESVSSGERDGGFAVFARRNNANDLYVWCGDVSRGGYTAFVWSLNQHDLLYSGEVPNDRSSDGMYLASDWQTGTAIEDEDGLYLCVVDAAVAEKIQARIPAIYRTRSPEFSEEPEADADDYDPNSWPFPWPWSETGLKFDTDIDLSSMVKALAGTYPIQVRIVRGNNTPDIDGVIREIKSEPGVTVAVEEISTEAWIGTVYYSVTIGNYLTLFTSVNTRPVIDHGKVRATHLFSVARKPDVVNKSVTALARDELSSTVPYVSSRLGVNIVLQPANE